MTPFGIILVTAVFSSQIIQTITQPKKYRCASFRPLPQPNSEPISSFILRVPPLSVTKSQSNTTKSPGSASKSSVSVNKSQNSVSKSPSSILEPSSSVTKSSSTVQKVTNSSRTANRFPPDSSFSLFKLPLQLISSLLVPLIPSTIRQNTSTIISPQFNLQMPLTISTFHDPKYIPSNVPVVCKNLPKSCNSPPNDTNNSNYIFCNSLLGSSHKSIVYNWICNSLLNKIQNVNCTVPPIECDPPEEPNSSTTVNPTVTPITTDSTVTPTAGTTPTDITTPTDKTTPKDKTTPTVIDTTTPTVIDTTTPTVIDTTTPTSTPQYPIPPCTSNTCHRPCIPLVHIPKPKPKPCSLPVTHLHSHIPLKHYPPLHHASCSPSYAYFNSLFDSTTYKPDENLDSNLQKDILLKILKSLISNSNL
ncbi:mucin-2-like [Melanaphis sacchari]|uniref:mucin-2-like n=1 Tax=Melanaphis sacchari TaxID=742174 RepID=UPI000DC14FCB|nr:mucin-2-like [Melanaphis sacchari]